MVELVIYTPEASNDIEQAFRWYEGREPGLGESFLLSVEARVRMIQRHPHAFPIAVDSFRRSPIRKFPHEIFYEPTTDAIVVYSVFHCSQDPQKWRKRLGFE